MKPTGIPMQCFGGTDQPHRGQRLSFKLCITGDYKQTRKYMVWLSNHWLSLWLWLLGKSFFFTLKPQMLLTEQGNSSFESVGRNPWVQTGHM